MQRLRVDVEDLIAAGVRAPAPRSDPDPSALARLDERREAWLRTARPQRRADLPYRSELDWRDRRVELRGRIDARHATRAGGVYEIIVGVPDPHGAPLSEAIERAALAALLAVQAGEDVHRVSVVQLDLADDATPGSADRVDVAFAPDAWSAVVDERLARIAAERERRADEQERRRDLAASLPFPFATLRPGQDTLVRDVAGAAKSGLVLLACAPTGIGKTASALQPLLAHALADDATLLFTTSRTSQQALALDTLRKLLPRGCGASAVQLSARERVCPLESLGCVDRRCPWQADFRERLERTGLLDELAREGVVDSALIRERASGAQLCPHEVSLSLALEASAVVADWNYVFDPDVQLRRLLERGVGHDLLVVDEAHGLPARARASWSVDLDLDALDEVAARCDRLQADLYARAATLIREATAHCRGVAFALGVERENPPPWAEPADRAFWEEIEVRASETLVSWMLHRSRHDAPEALRAQVSSRGAGPRDPLRSALAGLRDFGRRCARDPERFAALWSPTRTRLACIDAAEETGARIRSFRAAVCMSATLSPASEHARALGVDGPETVALELPSPFPVENRLLLAVDTIDTRYRHRSEDAERLANLLAACMRVRRGNYLAFFPSFAYRDEVLAKLDRSACKLLLQLPGVPAEPFLARLRANADGRETQLLAGVQGGVFAEGVDYPGEMAIGVFVIGPGLPAVDVEQELQREYHDGRRGDGFAHAYVFPGMQRVVQSAGRAIRAPDDRAAVVLIGRRFSESPYRDALPESWRRELIHSDDPVRELEAFWRKEPREC